jgi:hypothetical protein
VWREQTASGWFDDPTGAPVEANLRELAVALFKSKTVLLEMLRRDLFQCCFAYRARHFTLADVSDLYALQRLLQKLPTQIDVGVLRFRQAREEVLDNRAIVSNLFERRLRIRTGLLLQRLNLVSDLLI